MHRPLNIHSITIKLDKAKPCLIFSKEKKSISSSIRSKTKLSIKLTLNPKLRLTLKISFLLQESKGLNIVISIYLIATVAPILGRLLPQKRFSLSKIKT